MATASAAKPVDPRSWVARTLECKNCLRSFDVCHAHRQQAERQRSWSRSVRRAAVDAACQLLWAQQIRADAAKSVEKHGADSDSPWGSEFSEGVVQRAASRSARVERSAERLLAAVVDNDAAVIASMRSRYVVHFVLYGRQPHDRESERGHSPYPCGTPDSDTLEPSEATRGVNDWRQVTCRRCLASRRELDRNHDLQSSTLCPRCFTLRSLAGDCLC